MQQRPSQQQQQQWHIPLIAIRRDGALALSPAAYEALRPAQHVQLAYEPATHTLTLTPALSPDAPNGLALVRDGTAGLIRARRFCRRNGIAEELHHGRRYPAVALVVADGAGSRCLTVRLASAASLGIAWPLRSERTRWPFPVWQPFPR